MPNIPSFDTVLNAMKCDYDEATDEEVDGMKFFLNTVIPCVDPDVNRKHGWLEGCTHLQKFGDFWHSEMATGLLILKEYSNPENLIHNATTTGGDQVKKKRKRLHSKIRRDEHFDSYYTICNQMYEMRQELGFVERMERWDKECCISTDDRRRRGPADRINIVPTGNRLGNGSKSFIDFLATNDVFRNIFTQISPLTKENPVPPLTGGNDLPITQQPV
jgi:hypothetical protein